MKLMQLFLHQSKGQGSPELASGRGAQRARF